MSKRKGVSAEEKRIRILQLLHEKKDFFQLKELEKIAPKEKGIIAQSVKDVVQSLVDDGLVDSDKIGTSTYYWAYPSKALHLKRKRIQQLQDQANHLSVKITSLKENLNQARLDRSDSKERQKVLMEINDLNIEKNQLENTLRTKQDCDPKLLQELRNDIKTAKAAANRWTDNIYAVKSWCKNKFTIEGETLDKQFGIPSDLDYID